MSGAQAFPTLPPAWLPCVAGLFFVGWTRVPRFAAESGVHINGVTTAAGRAGFLEAGQFG